MPDPHDIDPGEPIAELAELAEEPRADFVERLWGRIERRQLGGQLTEMTWKGAISVLAEYLEMVLQLLGTPTAATGRRDDKGE